MLSKWGVAPHTTPVRAHPASLGTICAASRCAGVGSLVLRGPHGSRRLGRGGGSHSGSSHGRGGTIPPASGAGGRGPRGLRAGGGAGGGVSRRGLPALLPGGGLRYSILRHMGVLEELIRLFGTLSCGSLVRIITAHGPTPSIRLHRGLRQGSAESAVLYLLLLEPLLRSLACKAPGRCSPCGATPGTGVL